METKAHLMVEIQALLQERDPPKEKKECNICRVNCDVRRLNDLAYTPQVVSIGPLHHGLNKKQPDMERTKSVSFKELVERASGDLEGDEKISFKTKLQKDLVDLVLKIEPRVRICYSETLEITELELCKVILFDACFIIELFLKHHFEENDKILSPTWLASRVGIDLLLFENQLPFFAIEELFKLVFDPGRGVGRIYPSLIELAFDFFEYYNKQQLKPSPDDRIRHFTDLLRVFHLKRQSGRDNKTVEHLPSASELDAAGIKFRVKESSCLLDLELSGCVLKIPQLKLNDWTEILFRNMIALEQSQYPFKSYIIDYVAVMDFLINSSQDVDLLVQKKIVCSWMGDNNAGANLINGLLKNVTHSGFDNEHYSLCKRLNDFYESPLKNMKASLKRNYCMTPCVCLATFAAAALVILTTIQTFASVWQVAKPN